MIVVVCKYLPFQSIVFHNNGKMIKEPATIVLPHTRVEGGPGLQGRFRVFLGSKDHIFMKGKRDGTGKESIRENSNS